MLLLILSLLSFGLFVALSSSSEESIKFISCNLYIRVVSRPLPPTLVLAERRAVAVGVGVGVAALFLRNLFMFTFQLLTFKLRQLDDRDVEYALHLNCTTHCAYQFLHSSRARVIQRRKPEHCSTCMLFSIS
uniref:Secreted protein n=1 Tax=Glossina pallidipes TaxID=7398 RepID=A0A1B0AAY0_GLOPL